MGDKRKVVLATSNRAERGILEPVIRRLETMAADGRIDFELIEVMAEGGGNYFVEVNRERPDVILIPADRIEMMRFATVCYARRIPIFHLWAGVGPTGTWDDTNRRIISSMAYLMLSEDAECRRRLIASGEEPWRCIVTGTPHYDDMEVDESKVPDKAYDLVLVNTNPIAPDDYEASCYFAADLVERYYVWIGASDRPLEARTILGKPGDFYSSLPRPQFLGLLKNCKRFISNSSSAVYEAPFFGVEVVNPGRRNAARTTHAELKPGAADTIAEILATYPLEEKKLLKAYE